MNLKLRRTGRARSSSTTLRIYNKERKTPASITRTDETAKESSEWVFTNGVGGFIDVNNWRRRVSHNPELVNQQLCHGPYLSENAVCEFLWKRRSLLDGVVISGGEPTFQNDLFLLCEKIKAMGFLLKLDTNGSKPKIIKRLIDGGLIDYIAMDIKTDPFRYCPVHSCPKTDLETD